MQGCTGEGVSGNVGTVLVGVTQRYGCGIGVSAGVKGCITEGHAM